MTNNDPFTQEELELVERLRKAPQPELRKEKLDEIEQLIQRELQATSQPGQRFIKLSLVIATLILVTLIAIAIGLMTLRFPGIVTSSATPDTSSTVLPVTSTVVTPSPSASSAPTIAATLTPVAATSTPRMMQTPGATAISRTFILSSQKTGWLQTDIMLRAGDIYVLKTRGVVNIWPNCEQTKAEQGYPNLDCSLTTMGPNGTIAFPPAPGSYPYPGGLVGALVAKIGDAAPFLVGVGGAFTAQGDGALQFAFNDTVKMEDNQGAFTIVVNMSPGLAVSPSATNWTDLGVTVQGNHAFTITAAGTISLSPDCTEPDPQNTRCAEMLIGPNGTGTIEAAPVNYPLPGVPVGALIGRIGNGPAFFVGQGGMLIASASGLLQLGINDLPDRLRDAKGIIHVEVEPGPNGEVVSVPATAQDWIDSGITLASGQPVNMAAGSLPPCESTTTSVPASATRNCGKSGTLNTAALASDNYPFPKARIGALVHVGKIEDTEKRR